MKYVSKGICYVLLAAVSLHLAVLYVSRGLILLWGTLVFLPLIFLCMLLPARKKVTYTLSLPKALQDDSDRKRLGIVVNNTGTIPIYVKGKLLLENPKSGKRHKVKIRGRVGSREKALVSGKWKETELGMWQVSCEGIWIYEEFRWICVWKRMKRTGTIMILPKCFETNIKVGIRTRMFMSDGEQYDANWSGDDATEILKLRAYRDGDRINNIHWKLSARNGELIVKEMSLPLGCNVVFFLNTNNKKNQKTYWEIVQTISTKMVEEKCFHYLVWYDRTEEKAVRKAIKTEEDLYEFWMELAEWELKAVDLKQQYADDFPGEQYASFMELNEKLELFCNGAGMEEFREEQLEKQLQRMELIL